MGPWWGPPDQGSALPVVGSQGCVLLHCLVRQHIIIELHCAPEPPFSRGDAAQGGCPRLHVLHKNNKTCWSVLATGGFSPSEPHGKILNTP